MKKRILILLIIPILVFGFSTKVSAAEKCEGVKATISFFSQNSIPYGRMVSFFGIETSDFRFARQYIDGKPALCLDRTKYASDYYSYSGIALDNAGLSDFKTNVIKRAYNFLERVGESETNWAIAQIAVWAAMENKVTTYNGLINLLKDNVISFMCALDPNFPVASSDGCTIGGDAFYSYRDSDNGKTIAKSIQKFDQTGTNAFNLSYYTPSNGSVQRLVSYNACKETSYYCMKGTNKVDISKCVNTKLKNNVSIADAKVACGKQYCGTTPTQTPDPNPTPQPTCYYEVVKNGTPAVCAFTNTNNNGNFYETVQPSCNNTANMFGAPEEYFVNNTCRFYCLENASQSFPGNVSPALSKGTILVWPTSESNTISLSKNIFPLKFEGVRKCYLIMDGATGSDIYEKESPYVRYLNAYGYVTTNYSSRETISSISTQFGSVSHNSRLTYEQIRTSNYSYALSTGACDVYYSGYTQELNRVISSAESAINHWINTHTCYNTNYCKCVLQDKTDPTKCSQWNNPQECTSAWDTWQTERRCGIGDTPYENEYNQLISMRNQLEQSKSACRTYISNYILMKDTYLQVAACNNKTIDPKSLYNFETDATVSFEGANGVENVVLSKESEKYTCKNCSNPNQLTTAESDLKDLNFFRNNYKPAQFAELVNSLNPSGSRMREVIIDAVVSYTLPNNKITENKGNGNFSTSKVNGFKIDKESLVGKKYNLKIYNTKLGHKNSFVDLINKDYTCNYEVTETVTPDCICPEGTDNAGKDLYCMIYSSNTTCIEAQVNYCNNTSITIPDSCGTFEYCPNDLTKKLTPCIDAGYSYDYCEKLICQNNISDTYRCKNTNAVGGNMDITSCVYTKLAQGLSEQSAIDQCDALVCPIRGGLKIIYRTISLENPFPGKTISGGISGFNTNVNGRYPGSNWNSKNLVKNEILYSRSNSQSSYGSKIYQNEQPLYTFVLNTQTINSIRRYNDTHDYDDFLLDCKKNNATACVSTFVHDSNLSGLVGGTCQYNTSKTNFYKCSNDA